VKGIGRGNGIGSEIVKDMAPIGRQDPEEDSDEHPAGIETKIVAVRAQPVPKERAECQPAERHLPSDGEVAQPGQAPYAIPSPASHAVDPLNQAAAVW